MDTKNSWKNQEEKDAYFLKRKKRTKWFVIAFIMIMIVMMILFIWLLITLLNNSKKDIQGVWDCENGQMVLQIDKTELSESFEWWGIWTGEMKGSLGDELAQCFCENYWCLSSQLGSIVGYVRELSLAFYTRSQCAGMRMQCPLLCITAV